MPTLSSPQECAAQMLRLLGSQRDLFAQILDRARRQLQLIDTGDTDALMRLLGEKQRLIQQNETINRELEPVRRQWEQFRDAAGAGLRQPIEQAFEQLRGHIAEVVELENQAQARAEKAKSEAGAQVGRMQTGKAMLKAYGGARRAAPPDPRFHDKNG